MQKVHGLRVFLLILLNLVADGKSETCKWVEDNISPGIATSLFKQYRKEFERVGMNTETIEEIDAYYRNWTGCLDGKEQQYLVEKDNGLQLLIAICLNEIPCE